jgi:hypothetical protein
MNWRPPALSLLFQLPALHAQDAAALRAGADDALASGFWEVAIVRFAELLDGPELAAAEKADAAMNQAAAASAVAARNAPPPSAPAPDSRQCGQIQNRTQSAIAARVTKEMNVSVRRS